MFRPVAIGVLLLVSCRTSEDDLGERVALNESDLAAINTRLDALEADLQALAGSEETGAISETLSTLQEQVDALAGTVGEHEQDLYIHTEEIHQLSDEIAALRTDVNIHEADIASQATAIATNAASSAANASAITPIQADYLTSTDQAGLQANIDTNTATIATLTNTVSGNTGAITANTTAVADNTSDIAANMSALAAVNSDYLTSASAASLQAGIDANTADVSSIQSSYLPWIDDVSTYLDADTTAGVLSVAGANLEIDQRIFGESFIHRECNSTHYDCSPTDCLALCQANGERMAFAEEALAWASAGNDLCSWMWMLEHQSQSNSNYPVAAYPMYHNRPAADCGEANTGDVPRFGGYNAFSGDMGNWNVSATYNCACSSLK